MAHQLAAFVGNLPAYVERLQALIAEQGGPLIERLGGAGALADVQKSIGDVVRRASPGPPGSCAACGPAGRRCLGVFSLIVVTPVVAFYLLLDWNRMVATVDDWLPRRHRDTIRALAREIDRAISGFIRGQALVCLILGTFYAVGLTFSA